MEEKTIDKLRNMICENVAKHSNSEQKQKPCPFAYEKNDLQPKDINLNINKSEKEVRQRKYLIEQAKLSGGNRDRYNLNPVRPSLFNDNGSRYEEQMNSVRHYPCHSHTHSCAFSTKSGTERGKRRRQLSHQLMARDGDIGDHRRFRDSISEADTYVLSEAGYSRSQRSSKTGYSRKTSHELKKLLRAQCKFHDAVNETMQEMSKEEKEEKEEEKIQNDPNPPKLQDIHCKHCTDKSHAAASSQRDVTTEMSKTDFQETPTSDILTISVDDIVNTKVINPMIRKMQRMYLNNLNDEMSLMEDLERLPQKVNEVYKATIFKQNNN